MSSNDSGKNIHNAFAVVYETYKSVEKLISKCQNELDESKYYMPVKRFLRYSSDRSWEGWIYWSFILLYQRHEDGQIMKNNWINGPVYVVEINLDADTCEEPELIVAKFDFGDISDWSEGCSPSSHSIFYNPIHEVRFFDSTEDGEYEIVFPKVGYEERVETGYWGLKKLVCCSIPLVEVNKSNYQEKIFGTIEKLSKFQL